MLPHFVEQDFADVIEEQNARGLRARSRVVRAAFRIPLPEARRFRGAAASSSSCVRRSSPGTCMGEEGAAGGTVRYVDSSVERLQVKVTRARARPLCRHLQRPARCRCGRRAREGEFVAGVRYRAWQPSSALHPTIGIHSPLTFDIVDTWMKRSEGGCQYHVVHPGGRSHETFPVNAFEAESRRLARFFRIGHTPGTR